MVAAIDVDVHTCWHLRVAHLLTLACGIYPTADACTTFNRSRVGVGGFVLLFKRARYPAPANGKQQAARSRQASPKAKNQVELLLFGRRVLSELSAISRATRPSTQLATGEAVA
jgi:hypothetical protein